MPLKTKAAMSVSPKLLYISTNEGSTIPLRLVVVVLKLVEERTKDKATNNVEKDVGGSVDEREFPTVDNICCGDAMSVEHHHDNMLVEDEVHIE
ncbi:uncharacterized protein HKW66_Vig0038190 [Vigna angularis]|uniref:Uncharacterized protein n=1 Tax=Phaseolus angularis TaxID=3914 RepID=A0A8T0LA90_PHAAN|nr:uncharacterized protein HKW66_Vig0038190 [Vigna angularis]